jgi:hypothetical protein
MFMLGYIDTAGVEQRVDMTDAAVLPLETSRPVRTFPPCRGQLKNPGLWWSSTNSLHVPFQLWWAQHDGRDRPQFPGWFARPADGGGVE